MTSIITIESNRRFSKAISAAIVCGAFLFTSIPATAQISGVGSAVIDGTMSEGEWDGAGTISFPINLPDGGGTTPGTLHIMNDADNLYIALSFARTGLDLGNSFTVEFDNDGNGFLSDGDDGFVVNPSRPVQLSDNYRVLGPFTPTSGAPVCPSGALCGFGDTGDSGTNDGVGIAVNDGFNTIYEASKALDSADDTHDFSLIAGDTIGFFVHVVVRAGSTAETAFPAFGVFTESLQIAEAGASRILDFESLAHDGTFLTIQSPYHEDGFTITGVVPVGTPLFNVFGTSDGRFTGSTALSQGTIPTTWILTNDNNNTFDLLSIDVSEFACVSTSPESCPTHPISDGEITYIGTKPDTSTVIHSFFLDKTFGSEPIVFPATFTDLESVSVFISGDGTQFHQIDNVVLQVQSADAVPEAVDDFATAACGVDENIFVLANDNNLIDAPFIVSAQTPTDKGGTTVVNGSPNSDPNAIFVTYTPPPGFDGTDTFSYTVTDEGGSGESDTATVTVEVDGSSCQIEVGDTVIFNPDPDTGDQTVTAVVQEVVKAGTITQTSCVIEDDRGTAEIELDLVLKIKETQDCIDKGVAAKLEPTDLARLKTYQRAFADNKIVVTLIESRNTAGNPDDLTKGAFISEEDTTKQEVTERTCDVDDVSQSPTTVGVNRFGNEPSGERARNWTGTCNRTRSFGHLTDQWLFFPIRNDSAFLPPNAQANQEAGDFRLAVIDEQEAECVDDANKGKFLRELLGSFNAAWRLVGRKKFEEAIDGLITTTLIALDPAGLDPYGSCPNDPKGHFVSRLMDLTYHVHRGLLNPDVFVPFVIDPAILAELPAFPTDTPPPTPEP